jgi:ribosomal protein L20
MATGVDVLFEQNGSRTSDFRRGQSPLLDHRRISKDDLRQLYARRWNVELDLRNLKTSTGMDVLRCQTPQMNDKPLWVHRWPAA